MTTIKLLGLSSILFLTACGGGGSLSDEEPTKTLTPPVVPNSNYTITAIDGYLQNATAWLDLTDGVYNSTHPSALTDANGKAVLSIPSSISAANFPVIVEAKKTVTFDKGLNKRVVNDFTLAAPAGETIVTPYSTIVYLKMKSGHSKTTALNELSTQLKVPKNEILTDFIAANNSRMTLIAADLVRLDILPSSPTQLAEFSNDPKVLFSEVTSYASFQSDVNEFRTVVRNLSNKIDLDTDVDGVADSDDPDIDGDGITNDQDTYPYIFDRNTTNSPGELVLSVPQIETLLANQWHYYKLDTPEDILLNVTLSELNGDIDLYIKQGSLPTKFDYDCRSNNSFSSDENCLQRLQEGQIHYIAVVASDDSSYRLEAALNEIKVNKISLLLHGLASDSDTWDDLVNDDSFFSRSCMVIDADTVINELPQVNNQGLSCFRLNFGSFDRDDNLASQGLDGATCNDVSGCHGDFSTFELLGTEVESAMSKIVDKFGIDTEVVLLGHSRGGLAARSYLQKTDSENKEHVKALVTTGTPHQGSPLGRFYQYMEENCVPKITYEDDGGKCEDSWEVIKMIAGDRWFSDKNIMNLRAPSIDFLSPESVAIQNLNTNILSLENIITAQISYGGTAFGILGKDITPRGDYDLYKYQQFLGGDHPHPETLRYIEKGQSRESYVGDGIVPVYSQKLSLLLEQNNRSIDISKVVSANNVIHTEETERVTDLYEVFESLYPLIGWR